jgi:hypothetical protein
MAHEHVFHTNDTQTNQDKRRQRITSNNNNHLHRRGDATLHNTDKDSDDDTKNDGNDDASANNKNNKKGDNNANDKEDGQSLQQTKARVTSILFPLDPLKAVASNTSMNHGLRVKEYDWHV